MFILNPLLLSCPVRVVITLINSCFAKPYLEVWTWYSEHNSNLPTHITHGDPSDILWTSSLYPMSYPKSLWEAVQWSKNFKSKVRLNEHQISHSSERPFRCSVCSKNFKNKRALNVSLFVPCCFRADIFYENRHDWCMDISKETWHK